MDDNRFDEIIKAKVGEYEEPRFDPSALAAFHHQMTSVTPAPWYNRYRTEVLIGSSALLSTLVLLCAIWYFSSGEADILKKNTLLLQQQREQIESLQEELRSLKAVLHDTVQILSLRGTDIRSDNNLLLQRISLLEAQLEKVHDDLALYVLSEQQRFSSTDNQWANPTSDLSDLSPNDLQLKKEKDHSTSFIEKPGPQLSPTTIKELEKHYQKGIGIRVGPVLELSTGLYQDGGGGKLNLTAGVLGDFILSPSLSLETGAKFVHRVREREISSAQELSDLPYVNEDLGTVTSADVDSWMFEFPLNLKYRYPLSMKKHWIAGIGYSPLLYTKQLFEYEYDYQIDGSTFVTMSESYTEPGMKFEPGTINIMLGLSNHLKNKKILETSLYYQHILGSQGLENSRGGFLGIKTAYWFKIR